MQAKIFYETEGGQAIPLFLISQNQCEAELSNLPKTEQNCLALHEFKGKIGDVCCIPNADGLMDKAYIGSGEENQIKALANAARLLPPNVYKIAGTYSQEAAMSWALAQYRFEKYKKQEVPARLLAVPAEDLNELLAITQAHFLVRDLVNQPAGDLGPKELAEVVEQLAKTHKAEFKQWVGEELVKDNFPAIYTVGRAALASPRLLSLSWGDKKNPLITLVGKGVCFDSGGLDIKSAFGMRLMKKDMGGAAHVIGLAQWIMTYNLPVRLNLLIPAVENAIGPDAFKPGDIITMRNGITVEVHNTDAEGRLILADALVKACEDEPELLIDFSTLTGAARISLGADIAALFTNNDRLAESISAAAHKTVDPLWRLPLYAPYEELLGSNIADLANCSDFPYAGAIVAALFLQRFVSKSIPWMHFDVMAWNLRSTPGKPEGGEALGLRAVAEYLQKTYAN